jgi:hypothetical protein
MSPRRSGLPDALALLLAAACGDAPTVPPGPEPVRTVLVHRQDTGENVLLNSDGTEAGSYAPGGTALTPLGASPVAQALVLLQGDAVVMGVLGRPGLDTILRPAPTSLSLATISDDERLVALVAYAPTPGVIVYDRANRSADTLDFGAVEPVLPPVLAPADDRVALFGLTPTSIVLTVVFRNDPSRMESAALATSRFLNRPIQGWPRWNAEGIHLAFVREAGTGPDTLLVGRVSPDEPGLGMEERYRVVLAPVDDRHPEVDPLRNASTYALTADAAALALGAAPDHGSTHHAIYIASSATARLQVVRSDPQQFLIYPLFVRR